MNGREDLRNVSRMMAWHVARLEGSVRTLTPPLAPALIWRRWLALTADQSPSSGAARPMA